MSACSISSRPRWTKAATPVSQWPRSTAATSSGSTSGRLGQPGLGPPCGVPGAAGKCTSMWCCRTARDKSRVCCQVRDVRRQQAAGASSPTAFPSAGNDSADDRGGRTNDVQDTESDRLHDDRTGDSFQCCLQHPRKITSRTAAFSSKKPAPAATSSHRGRPAAAATRPAAAGRQTGAATTTRPRWSAPAATAVRQWHCLVSFRRATTDRGATGEPATTPPALPRRPVMAVARAHRRLEAGEARIGRGACPGGGLARRDRRIRAVSLRGGLHLRGQLPCRAANPAGQGHDCPALTQRDLADALGIAEQQMQRCESISRISQAVLAGRLPAGDGASVAPLSCRI